MNDLRKTAKNRSILHQNNEKKIKYEIIFCIKKIMPVFRTIKSFHTGIKNTLL